MATKRNNPQTSDRTALVVLSIHRSENPLLFPVGNMFWTRRSAAQAVNDVFGADYPWPNEPIANDGAEFHLIERLWPAVASKLGLDSVFLHKLDEQRV